MYIVYIYVYFIFKRLLRDVEKLHLIAFWW